MRAGELHVALTEAPGRPGTEVSWCVRPEDVFVHATRGHPATVVDVVALGPVTELTLAIDGGGELAATTANGRGLAVGSPVGVMIEPGALTVWLDDARS